MSDGNLTAAFGSFEDWNWQRPMVVHVLTELARAHYDDADGEGGLGGALGGGLKACAGLSIALIAD